MNNRTFNPDDYPSIDLVHNYVQPSYDWMLGRLDAAKERLHKVLGLGTTITLAAPTLGLAVKPQAPVDSGWLISAIFVYFIVLATGIIIIAFSPPTKLASLQLMYQKFLHYDQAEFKKTEIYLAGEAFEHNFKIADRIGAISRLLFVLI